MTNHATAAKALKPWYRRKRFLGVIAGAILATSQGCTSATNTESVDSEESSSNDSATEDTVGTGLGSQDASGDIDSLDCGSPDAIGAMYPSVKITNRSEKRSNYFVTVTFESADGLTKYEDALIMVMSLNPGQSMSEEGIVLGEIPSDAICKVTEVQRTSDE